MLRNQANAERFGRVAIGLAILLLFFSGPKSVWGLLGIIPVFTGILGWCPLYQVFGISTYRRTSSTNSP